MNGIATGKADVGNQYGRSVVAGGQTEAKAGSW